MARLELSPGESEAGARLDVVLAGHPRIGSRAAAQRLIDEGRVTVDGRVRAKGHRLAAGERVAAEVQEEEEAVPRAAGSRPEPPTVPYAVVFEDDHLIVVDKPAGVVVHPGHGQSGGTLAQALAGRTAGGPPERRGIVHRLDRDTSGLLVVAKTAEAHAALTSALRRRTVRRTYLALVEGIPDARSGTIDAPLGRDRSDRTVVSTDTDRPRAARTRFELHETLARTALLEIELETGRTHQIRAHMAAIGHPVCGDGRYGGAATGRRLGLDRQFLHSTRLGLAHPATAEPLDFGSTVPPDLAAALEAAREETAEPGRRRS